MWPEFDPVNPNHLQNVSKCKSNKSRFSKPLKAAFSKNGVKDILIQGYDSGSNMKEKNIGLQKRILDNTLRALYEPYEAHTLNLIVNDAVSSSGEFSEFLITYKRHIITFLCRYRDGIY
ncbi:hypothetical protein TNCV_2027451 [Trichonephila clavipes]|nr:hypothetical protein TNCV_2027451 [Trichonephila clavipes]